MPFILRAGVIDNTYDFDSYIVGLSPALSARGRVAPEWRERLSAYLTENDNACWKLYGRRCCPYIVGMVESKANMW